MKLYKAEFFDNTFTFLDWCTLAQPIEISFDYLTIEPCEVTASRKMNVAHDSFVSITDNDGATVYQGILTESFQEKNGTTRFLIRPLISICKIDYFADLSSMGNIETFLATALNTLYDGADTSQNITGFTATATTTTAASIITDSKINNLMYVVRHAFKFFAVVCNMSFDPQAKTFTVTITENTTTARVIETNLPNIIDYNIVFGGITAVNKITYVNETTDTTTTYYLHDDGTISAVDEKRITPVIAAVKYLSASEYSGAATVAEYDLTPELFNNLIEITTSNEDNLVCPCEWNIGDIGNIYNIGVLYQSALTGFIKSTYTTTLIFGQVRQELTKRLILERG